MSNFLNIKNISFWKLALLMSSGKEVPTLVDPSVKAILSHWAQEKQETY
jgi:hypothetical protein